MHPVLDVAHHRLFLHPKIVASTTQIQPAIIGVWDLEGLSWVWGGGGELSCRPMGYHSLFIGIDLRDAEPEGVRLGAIAEAIPVYCLSSANLWLTRLLEPAVGLPWLTRLDS
jgi:hypothetical protein